MESERCLSSHWSTDSGSFGLSEEVWRRWARLELDQLFPVWEFPVETKIVGLKKEGSTEHCVHLWVYIFITYNKNYIHLCVQFESKNEGVDGWEEKKFYTDRGRAESATGEQCEDNKQKPSTVLVWCPVCVLWLPPRAAWRGFLRLAVTGPLEKKNVHNTVFQRQSTINIFLLSICERVALSFCTSVCSRSLIYQLMMNQFKKHLSDLLDYE